MITTDDMRTKLKTALKTVRPGETASFIMSDVEVAVMVKMDLEDAIKALGKSQRVQHLRAILADAMNTCEALIASLSDKEASQITDEETA
jgi:hypothetical protein